jgi:transposase-like protein
MGKPRRVFTREFKVAAVSELKSGKPIGSVARRLEVSPNTLDRWRRELKKNPSKAFSGNGNRMLAASRDSELEQKIGQLTMEIDFLKKLLLSFEEQQEAANGNGRSTTKSVKKTRR